MRRDKHIAALQGGRQFDLLVIGGGATGCGIALDAATRGLTTALVERADFAEGTSSRSTKLVHGGVRYLEMAVRQVDRGQYNLVRDALLERFRLLHNAPHLTRRVTLLTPLFKWLEVPYVWSGLKLYDLLAGKHNIGPSQLVGREELLTACPMLRRNGLKAGVRYYDGQFLDARMALDLALTAAENGATVANHVSALEFIRHEGRVTGAVLRDELSGVQWSLQARQVINATGPFVDEMRRLDEPDCPEMLEVSSGVHLVLPGRFIPPGGGLMIPKTEDGRILFVLPWQGHALVGTTDEPATVETHPRPREEEIAYLLRHLRRYLHADIDEQDITATWCGLRPLVHEPSAKDTARLSRDHVLTVSRSGLLTIAGGKWTTYRRMAEDTVDRAVATAGLQPKQPCRTKDLVLLGGRQLQADAAQQLQKEFALEPETSVHLAEAYGDRAAAVAALTEDVGSKSLHADFPYLEAEVVYAARHELAERLYDILAHRLPLAFLNRKAAAEVTDRALSLLAAEKGWDDDRCKIEQEIMAERLDVAL